MAYSNWGAFVYCNGERRTDKEDAPAFATGQETFGRDINTIPSGLRIWTSLFHAKENNREPDRFSRIYHGVLGDGPVRVLCYKYGLPEIYDFGCKDGPKAIDYYDSDKIDCAEFEPFSFEFVASDYKTYKFFFDHGDQDHVEMTEPDGTVWSCDYGYGFGAGFEE